MKGILLLAALHILIIYQSQKKHSKENNILPAPSSKPDVAKKIGPGTNSPLPVIQGLPGFLSAFYYVNTGKFSINAVARF